MTAALRRHGRGNSGHIGAICDTCRDLGGRPWQQWHSTRTIEGQTLAERDRDAHNRAHHPSPDGLPTHLPVGTVVRRGNGTKLWRIAGIAGDDLIVLAPVDGYTTASVHIDRADTLTVVEAGDDR